MDYSRKKTWGLSTYIFETSPQEFLGVFHTKKLHRILLSHPFEVLGPKTKTPGNSTFLITSIWKLHFVFN